MLEFLSVPVGDDRARTLLGEYFAHRAAGFPAAQGAYRVAYPDDDRFALPGGVFLLTLLDDAAVGCGGIRQLADETNALGEVRVRFEVKHLYVRPHARGSGAGRALLVELEHRAHALGASEIVLDTNRSLTAAGRLYSSSGYLPIPAYNSNPNATDWFGKRLAER